MVMNVAEIDHLIRAARFGQERARPHLSKYRVGAALLDSQQRIHIGCNFEFDNYSNTIHAEECALSVAVAAGALELKAICVVTSGDDLAWPCGMCRQSLYEIGGPDLLVIAANGSRHEVKSMAELLPCAFRL